jgi:phage terminase large subunit-like protein
MVSSIESRLRRVKAENGLPFTGEQDILDAIAPFATKFFWFEEKGYSPHLYQLAFHVSAIGGKLRRYRHLVAGRRGGKTLSAAWEVVYYCANPTEWWHDARGLENDEPLHVWVLVPDYRSSGRAARAAVRKVLKDAGFVEGVDYKENRGDLFVEFTNGSLIEFKTAERPDKLVGAGLHILWIDEAALIPDMEAWNIARPALSDHVGLIICTTTPREKNWYYDMVWGEKGVANQQVSSVEYWSIHNPYFPTEEWEEARLNYHPLMFKREFMASFDSMAGIELSGEWLKYFTFNKETTDQDVLTIPRKDSDSSKYALRTYMGVDPAVSLADDADRFAISLVGVSDDNSQAFLLRQWAGRIPFHEQLEKIQEWHQLYTPLLIGIEAVAYQRVLADQAARLEGLPPVVPMFAPGKKFERIMSMAPLFKIGKIRIHQSQQDFIDEWISYDSTKRNTKDDCLDSTEIALRTAGILLPRKLSESAFTEKTNSWDAFDPFFGSREGKFDPDMGMDF